MATTTPHAEVPSISLFPDDSITSDQVEESNGVTDAHRDESVLSGKLPEEGSSSGSGIDVADAANISAIAFQV